jgi:uncharacterized protein YndB with AHSA1/START domain
MADIRHRVGVDASAERVYQALATREGLARWWTRDVRGEAEAGGKLEFFFGGPEAAAVMEVTDHGHLRGLERLVHHAHQAG